MATYKLALVGAGDLNRIVVQACKGGLLDDYEIVGVYSRTQDSLASFAAEAGCAACSSLEALLALRPDYVLEAASPAAVAHIAEPVLRSGAHLVVLSIGAFADRAFHDQVVAIARAAGRRVHLASGAIGGFDVLRTAALMGQVEASISTRKGPASLEGTACDPARRGSATDEVEVFSGSARQAIALLPTKVNVAVATALATAGVDATRVSITSLPGFRGDCHRIEVRADEVHAVVEVYSETSAIAGWSVVALLRNLVSPLVFSS